MTPLLLCCTLYNNCSSFLYLFHTTLYDRRICVEIECSLYPPQILVRLTFPFIRRLFRKEVLPHFNCIIEINWRNCSERFHVCNKQIRFHVYKRHTFRLMFLVHPHSLEIDCDKSHYYRERCVSVELHSLI